MVIHLFTRIGPYSLKFLHFYKANFDINSCIFVFRQHKPPENILIGLEDLRIIFIPDFPVFIKVLHPYLIRADHIYFHYFSSGPVLLYWLIMNNLMSKTTWIVWGYDLHWGFLQRKRIKEKIFESIRRILIRRMHSFFVFIDGDWELLQRRYRPKGKRYYVFYPLPAGGDNNDVPYYNKDGVFRILTGNSAWDANKHNEIFDILSKYASEDLQLLCPLSYGGDDDYIKRVIAHGNDIFDEKFIPLLDLMPPEQYSDLLKRVSVVILNYDVQAGLGNVLGMLNLGKKVYIRAETTPYMFLKDKGFYIFDTASIRNMTFFEFISFDAEKQAHNKALFNKHFSNNAFVEMWRNAFQHIEG